MQLIIFQIKASDDVILKHITLSQFYTTVKICYAFSVCSDVKKFQNLSDKNILFVVCSNHILAFSLYMGTRVHGLLANFPEFSIY